MENIYDGYVTKEFLEMRLRSIEERITNLVVGVTPSFEVPDGIPIPAGRITFEKIEEPGGPILAAGIWRKAIDFPPTADLQWWLVDWDSKDPSRVTTWHGSAFDLHLFANAAHRVARIRL